MVPHYHVTLEVPNTGDGHCPSVEAEVEGTSELADVGKEKCMSEDVNYRLVV